MFIGIAVVLSSTNAHAVTGNGAWKVLTVPGALIQVFGWVLFVRDGRRRS
ncbi:hypothetical protein [Streptomyces angustmyceticus]|nr:hypothetical protein [Streptomyces angustmyceticus]